MQKKKTLTIKLEEKAPAQQEEATCIEDTETSMSQTQ